MFYRLAKSIGHFRLSSGSAFNPHLDKIDDDAQQIVRAQLRSTTFCSVNVTGFHTFPGTEHQRTT
jgi:hypothetical protein